MLLKNEHNEPPVAATTTKAHDLNTVYKYFSPYCIHRRGHLRKRQTAARLLSQRILWTLESTGDQWLPLTGWFPWKSQYLPAPSPFRHILSAIHYKICGAAYFQFTHLPCDDWENVYILSYYHHHHQIGSMNHYPLFRVRSWNNGMRCMSLYVLICSLGLTSDMLRCTKQKVTCNYLCRCYVCCCSGPRLNIRKDVFS